MNFLILKPIKSHMLASLEYMYTVMFKNFLKMTQSQQTHFFTSFNKPKPELKLLYFGAQIWIIEFLVSLNEPLRTALDCLFELFPVLQIS